MGIRIPSEYQEVEYLESTGSQHIDSEIPYNSNLSFEATASFTDRDSGNGLFGTNDYIFSLYMRTGGVTQFQNKSSQRFESSALTLNTFYDFKASVSGYWIDGTLQTSKNDSGKTPTSNIFIFKAMDYLGRVKLKAFRIYSDSNFTTLVRDYVPCYRKIDREAGLYDLVSGTFFENNGTGAFKVGKAVNVIRKFQPGIVGKTNVVEGAVIPDPHGQLVNYMMLYDEGDECTDMTGGWIARKPSSVGSGWTAYVPTLTKNETNMVVTIPGGAAREGQILPTNAVDVTEYSLAAFHGSASVPTLTRWLNTWFTIPDVATEHLCGSTPKTTSFVGLRTIDVSGVNGSVNTIIGLSANSASTTATKITVNHVFLAKADDYNALCDKAGVSTFATVDALIADTTAISAILSNASAVKHMVKRCTGDFMVSFVASSACLSLLESSPYKTIVQANEHWAKFLAMVA